MIKKYFLVRTEHLPHNLTTHYVGEYHYLTLDSGWHALVLRDGSRAVPTEWQELPHLLDPTTTVSPEHLLKLSCAGVCAEHRGFQMAKQLAKTHPAFEP